MKVPRSRSLTIGSGTLQYELDPRYIIQSSFYIMFGQRTPPNDKLVLNKNYQLEVDQTNERAYRAFSWNGFYEIPTQENISDNTDRVLMQRDIIGRA